MGIRIKPIFEIWALRIDGREVVRLPTTTKSQRKILNELRQGLIDKKIVGIELTNRVNRIERVLRLRQSEVVRKDADRNSVKEIFGGARKLD